MSHVAATSARSRAVLGLVKEKSQADKVWDIVRGFCRAGGADLSLREIQQRFNLAYGVWLDVSSISARVNALVTAKRLMRSSGVRKCSVSGVDIHPVFVLLSQQDRLVD